MNTKIIFGIIAVIIAIIFFIVPMVTADIPIYNETRENSIYWYWTDEGVYNVWIDNSLILTNYTVNNTLLTDLNTNEMHLIELRDINNTEIVGRSYTVTNTTSENVLTSINEFFNYNSWLFWFLMGIGIFILGVISYKVFWIATIGCEIISLVLYIPEVGMNANTIGMLLVYISIILVSGLGYRQER